MISNIKKSSLFDTDVFDLPLGLLPKESLKNIKKFVKAQNLKFKAAHYSDVSGLELCKNRAHMVDTIIKSAFNSICFWYTNKQKKTVPIVAIIALGGYGRAELNPHSDIDLLFLHDGSLLERSKGFWELLNENIVYLLFDLGLKVGHSVRSLQEAFEFANKDLQTKTSFLESRFISGETSLYSEFEKGFWDHCIAGQEDSYIAERLRDQAFRREKFGNSACMLEPNIKNGCGGLRDFQNLIWMIKVKYRTNSLDELLKKNLILKTEKRALQKAYDFLLRVRTELHLKVDRPIDVLTKNLQPHIALAFGFTNKSIVDRLEAFMRLLYTHMRNVYIITKNVEERLALGIHATPANLSKNTDTEQSIGDGFKIIDGKLASANDKIFVEQPRRIIKAFLLAQQRKLKLHPLLIRLIQEHANLVTKKLQKDKQSSEIFIEILNKHGSVANILRIMHETGILGKFLPEFGKLTCLVQHEFFHRYAADEHTLMSIEQLDKIVGSNELPYRQFIGIFQKVEQPYILYLSLLLHDSGKSDHSLKKHTPLSVKLAERAVRRLQLPENAAQSIITLVQNHLAMIRLVQTRDLNDPQTPRVLAKAIKSRENLKMLMLLTFADTMGTSPSLWNGFKESLLWNLYKTTNDVFKGEDDSGKLKLKSKDNIKERLQPILKLKITTDELQAHLDNLPEQYFKITGIEEIAKDIELVHEFLKQQFNASKNPLAPAVRWQKMEHCGFSTVSICTWDRPALFYKIAGAFTLANLNILGAHVFSRTDNIIIDKFFVVSAGDFSIPGNMQSQKFENTLEQILTTQSDKILNIDLKPQNHMFLGYIDEIHIPTTVEIDNESSLSYTIIDVETEDRLGLLYLITKTLSELGLNIFIAKITTEKGAAIDSFYVTNNKGEKITSSSEIINIKQRLTETLRHDLYHQQSTNF